MPKHEKAPHNSGQQKQHTVRDKDGAESTMTQEDWRNRDKSAGLERVDDVEDVDAPDTDTPVAVDTGNTDAPTTDTPVVAPPA